MDPYKSQETQPTAPSQGHGQHGGNPVIVSPVIVQPVAMGDSPQHMSCPHCQQNVTTSVTHNNGVFTHVLAGVLCLMGCWPCCLIPYCVDSTKDTEHVCPNCNKFIGVKKRL